MPTIHGSAKSNNFVITQTRAHGNPIIKIGNSKGLPLSKDILKQYNFTDKVELVMEAEHIILKPITAPREGWDEAFEQVKSGGAGSLLIDDVFDDEDFEPWK